MPKTTIPENSVAEEAKALLGELLSDPDQRLALVAEGQRQRHSLPAVAQRLLLKLLEELAEGRSPMVMSSPQEISTQRAADLLGVSRPFLIQRIEAGLLPARRVGTHRRVALEDVLRLREKMRRDRQRHLDALAADAQDLDLGY